MQPAASHCNDDFAGTSATSHQTQDKEIASSTQTEPSEPRFTVYFFLLQRSFVCFTSVLHTHMWYNH